MECSKTVSALRLLSLIAGTLGVGASYWYYSKSASRLDISADSLRHCEQIATSIRLVRESPHRARIQTWSQDDLGTVIEKAAADAQLARDRVLRIDPQPPKRIGKTDYQEQLTEVELLAVTLRQLVDFVFNVTSSDDQLEISTLRMRMPHESQSLANPELWLADVILTQRVYAPTNSEP